MPEQDPPPFLPEDPPGQFLVVPSADAEKAREALGRLYAESIGKPYPIPSNPPTPGAETKYYVDPKPSTDGQRAALGPKDAFIDGVLGKTVETTSGPYTLPTQYESLESSWFA